MIKPSCMELSWTRLAWKGLGVKKWSADKKDIIHEPGHRDWCDVSGSRKTLGEEHQTNYPQSSRWGGNVMEKHLERVPQGIEPSTANELYLLFPKWIDHRSSGPGAWIFLILQRLGVWIKLAWGLQWKYWRISVSVKHRRCYSYKN